MATNNSIDNKVTSGNFTVVAGNAVITAGNVTLPTTSSTVGQITINSVPFLHGYGTSNVFIGGAGNFTATATQCVCAGVNAGYSLGNAGDQVLIGFNAGYYIQNTYNGTVAIGSGACPRPCKWGVIIGMEAFGGTTTGSVSDNVALGYRALYGSGACSYAAFNIAIGSYSGNRITSSSSGEASNNTMIGRGTGYYLTTGSHNVLIGSGNTGGYDIGSGAAYTSSESNNICIKSVGVVGESNVIRIGALGDFSQTHTKAYIHGIYNYTGTIGTTGTAAMIIDSAGQIQCAHAFSADAACKTVSLIKSRGTSATPTVITTGDALGIIDFRGHDGTGYIVGSQITSTNSGTVATDRIASDLKFYTHPDSTTASTLRMTIASTGETTIAAADSGTELTVTGEISATTVYATTFDTNVAAAAVTLSGTTLAADGTDSDIAITLTPKGASTLVSTAVYNTAVGGTNKAVYVDDSGNIGYDSSSIRFKENVQDVEDASNFIYLLRPVTFNYKLDTNKTVRGGLIAEEVDKIKPELVGRGLDGSIQNVDYTGLVPYLLNEIQKLHKRIEILEAKLEEKKCQ